MKLLVGALVAWSAAALFPAASPLLPLPLSQRPGAASSARPGPRRHAVVTRSGDGESSGESSGESTTTNASGSTQGQRWFTSKLGNIDSLALVETSVAPPLANQVTVEIECVGLNMADVWTVLGLYKAAPPEGVCPGLEFCGVVTAVGAGVGDVGVGTRVMGFSRFGAFATHITIDSPFVRPLPAGWTAEQGASFVVQGITAWHALVELVGLRERCARAASGAAERPVVLVHSAAGGVGLNACEICEKLGASVVGTVGSEGKKDFLVQHSNIEPEAVVVRPAGSGGRAKLKGLFVEAATAARGATATAAQAGPDASVTSVPSRVASVAGVKVVVEEDEDVGCVDIVLDGIGGVTLAASVDVLARGGRLVHFGGSTYMTKGDAPNYWHIVPRWLMRPRYDPGSLVGR